MMASDSLCEFKTFRRLDWWCGLSCDRHVTNLPFPSVYLSPPRYESMRDFNNHLKEIGLAEDEIKWIMKDFPPIFVTGADNSKTVHRASHYLWIV
jgi:hypothetical protein